MGLEGIVSKRTDAPYRSGCLQRGLQCRRSSPIIAFLPRSRAAPALAWKRNAPPSPAFAKAEGFDIAAEYTEVETGKGADALAKVPSSRQP